MRTIYNEQRTACNVAEVVPRKMEVTVLVKMQLVETPRQQTSSPIFKT